jgi:capsular polysaccharide biosynthesis protein
VAAKSHIDGLAPEAHAKPKWSRSLRFRNWVLAAVERLAELGFRPPKTWLAAGNRVYKAYCNRVTLPRLARRKGLSGIVLVRREQPAPWQKIGSDRTVVIREQRLQRFLDCSVNYPRYAQSVPSQFVCTLRNAFLHIPSGAVITPDGRLIPESISNKVEFFLSRTRVPSEPVSIEGRYATLMHRINRNYFHWMIDCLPRTYILSQMSDPQPVTLLVPASAAPFQRLSLEWCLPNNVDVKYVPDEWVRVEQLVLPSFPVDPPLGLLPPECLDYVRTRIFERLGLQRIENPKRRIYVSRAGTGWKRVVNETEVTDLLAKFGFETIRPERLSLEDQVKLFHAAEMVAGGRGAGLANILFSTRIKVLEITAQAPFVGEVYFGLSQALGHQYHYLFTKRAGTDYEVDLEKLEAVLTQMMEGGNGSHDGSRDRSRAN